MKQYFLFLFLSSAGIAKSVVVFGCQMESLCHSTNTKTETEDWALWLSLSLSSTWQISKLSTFRRWKKMPRWEKLVAISRGKSDASFGVCGKIRRWRWWWVSLQFLVTIWSAASVMLLRFLYIFADRLMSRWEIKQTQNIFLNCTHFFIPASEETGRIGHLVFLASIGPEGF